MRCWTAGAITSTTWAGSSGSCKRSSARPRRLFDGGRLAGVQAVGQLAERPGQVTRPLPDLAPAEVDTDRPVGPAVVVDHQAGAGDQRVEHGVDQRELGPLPGLVLGVRAAAVR